MCGGAGGAEGAGSFDPSQLIQNEDNIRTRENNQALIDWQSVLGQQQSQAQPVQEG